MAANALAALGADAMTRVRELAPRRAGLRAMAQSPKADLVAGLTVAIVALPLALAFGAASGLGAGAGVATAIVAGIVASIFGGSAVQVSGPTGAMTVVLVPVFHRHGSDGVLMVGLMAGLILVAMAWARIGGWVRFLPVSVLEGFTAGIAVVIALQQVPAALGVRAEAEKVWRLAWEGVLAWLADPHWIAPAMAGGVAGVMLIVARLRPGWPIGIVALTLATIHTKLAGFDLQTIGSIPVGLPVPSLDYFDLQRVGTLVFPALAVAALAALESLLCATAADAMRVRGRHDPDRELFGQGLANMAASAFGGVPATAAIARTAVNVRAGGQSRLAAVSHSVFLLLIMFTLASVVSFVPLAALAGVLFATTARMVEPRTILALVRSTRGDAFIVLLTFAVTVLVDLVTAVGVGLAVAIVLALRDVARSAVGGHEELDLEDASPTEEERALLRQHIVAYRLDGPLVFAAAHQMLMELPNISGVRVVIIRMSRVTSVDATGVESSSCCPAFGPRTWRFSRRWAPTTRSSARTASTQPPRPPSRRLAAWFCEARVTQAP
jgi:SulP family sulfate permease